MRIFRCRKCNEVVYFENFECLNCGSVLGFSYDDSDLIALYEGPDRTLHQVERDVIWQRCETADFTGCNWLVPARSSLLCRSCALTRTRPSDGDADGIAELVRAEIAKRRLIFQLSELGLELTPYDPGSETGIAFDLLSSSATKVMTGHSNGVITLDLAEADSDHRERLRLELAEPYRTLLGHFRHEIGHYFWPKLVHTDEQLRRCRSFFGDDREDYSEALKRHYDSIDSEAGSWREEHISRYASMHPYEDWAETFAHYLHMLDTLQTAESFHLSTTSLIARDSSTALRPYGSRTFEELLTDWLELLYAMNQVNRSMGQEDLYPFVVAPRVMEKLAFVDEVVTEQASFSLRKGRVAQ
jgi:hypothetical protein